MLLLSVFDCVEFYVIAAVVAAAVVAASALPARRGEARTFLYAGTLEFAGDDDPDLTGQPALQVEVDDYGLRVRRTGLAQEDIHGDGAVSFAVQIIGFDVVINERLVRGRGRFGSTDSGPLPGIVKAAHTLMDCFGRERYHFQYISEKTGRMCAFSLNISPGNRLQRPLEL
ncbi:MAG: hypothetical protein NC131_13445 [Roseburia sp.]|nr:hypothetical protein [Roseburia sp.]